MPTFDEKHETVTAKFVIKSPEGKYLATQKLGQKTFMATPAESVMGGLYDRPCLVDFSFTRFVIEEKEKQIEVRVE